MASSKDYLDLILDSLGDREDITYRPMMGEYVLYYKGKVIGGIYDDRFLVKPTRFAKALMPHPHYELPYDGAKEMLLVEELEDRELLSKLIAAVYNDLPRPKTKR